MGKWVSATEKRSFLKWFLENQQLKRKEARKVIEFIIHHFHILENARFTEKIMLDRKTIVISSVGSDEPGFLYYFQQRKSEEVSTAIGDLMMNPSEKVNLIFHFRGKMENYRYLQLIEQPAIENIKHYAQFQKYEKEVNDLIEKISLDYEIALVKKQIDEALDQKDQELFKSLTGRLKELDEKSERIIGAAPSLP